MSIIYLWQLNNSFHTIFLTTLVIYSARHLIQNGLSCLSANAIAIVMKSGSLQNVCRLGNGHTIHTHTHTHFRCNSMAGWPLLKQEFPGLPRLRVAEGREWEPVVKEKASHGFWFIIHAGFLPFPGVLKIFYYYVIESPGQALLARLLTLGFIRSSHGLWERSQPETWGQDLNCCSSNQSITITWIGFIKIFNCPSNVSPILFPLRVFARIINGVQCCL